METGADITCISDESIPRDMENRIGGTKKIISGPDGKRLPVVGCIQVRLLSKKLEIPAKVYVIRQLKQNLLGKPEIKRFNLIREVNRIQEDNSNNIASGFSELFKGIGQFKKELNIEIVENAKPFLKAVPRIVPVPLLPKLKKEIDRLLKQKIIRHVDFPTEGCSPIVVVSKKDCDKIRICCDYTKLNENVKCAHFPINKVDVTLSSLKGSKIFSKLDTNFGFYQIKLNENNKF